MSKEEKEAVQVAIKAAINLIDNDCVPLARKVLAEQLEDVE